jgi:hypothetical protein
VTRILLFLAALMFPALARADTVSTSYLTIVAHGHDVDVEWSLALRDLEDAVGLDSNGDGSITWAELSAASGKIASYAQPRLRLVASGAECPEGEAQLLVDHLAGSAYAVLRYTARCPVEVEQLDLTYSALFEIDLRHRGLVNLTMNGAAQAAVFSPDQPTVHFGAKADSATIARQFVAAGVTHLLGGADHLLFIVMLLVPALLRAEPALSGLSRLTGVARVLTAFTVAHGMALTLAVLRLVAVPSTLAAPAIAFTILLTAADNIRPFLPVRREAVALGFGLVHGLAVAGGLGPLALPPGLLALALLSFNLGLEATQLVIAVAFAPIGFCLRATRPASHRVMPMLSGAAAIIAALWLSDGLQQGLHDFALPDRASTSTVQHPIAPTEPYKATKG